MSDRNGSDDRAILALAFVVFSAIFALIGYSYGVEEGQSTHAENYAESHKSYAADKIESTCVGMDAPLMRKCIQEAVEASVEQQRAEKDLAAQQNMAKWARWLLGLAIFTAAVTGFGVWYVRDTLVATREMASETTRIGDTQTRAYISISDAFITQILPGNKAKISITIENSGQSPAYDFRIVSTTGFIFADPETIDIPEAQRHPEGTGTIVGARSKVFHNKTTSNVIVASDVQAIKSARAHFVASGWINYKTSIGGKRTDRFLDFRLLSLPESFKEEKGWVALGPARSGNDGD